LYKGTKQSGQGYGQITVVVTSRREEYEVDGSGRRKAGGGSRVIENESICVFEVSFADSKGRWRLATIMEDQTKEDLTATGMATADRVFQQR